MALNKRMFYAIKQLQIAPDGTLPNAYTTSHLVHGLQSIGMTTKFNLEQIFELGQLSIYENIENIPEVQVNLDKVFDGNPILYHLATPTATSLTLAGRSNEKCQALLTIYNDTKDSASGSPIVEVECSGLFVNSWSCDLSVQDSFKESIGLIGSNKFWRATPSGTGRFTNNNDSPIGSGGVQRREDILFGSGSGFSILPSSVRGISAFGRGSGYNISTSGIYGASIQSVRVSVNLNRETINELGRRRPYHRFVKFPVEIKTDIDCISKDGDFVNAFEDIDNLSDEKILIYLREGTVIDCGSKNKLENITFGGGNAGRGGNDSMTYSYVNSNDLTILHPLDPALSTVDGVIIFGDGDYFSYNGSEYILHTS